MNQKYILCDKTYIVVQLTIHISSSSSKKHNLISFQLMMSFHRVKNYRWVFFGHTMYFILLDVCVCVISIRLLVIEFVYLDIRL